ncbi:MAG TPA: HAD hydrolase-like protein, partial [Acidobacteriaceae bacterium]|nr:HAD hydrolase-like protein [Acidobacteriaceae bacterium]
MPFVMLTIEDWDSFDCYLFDIDGTLLHCRDAVHYFAFLDCLRELAGRALSLEGIPVHGSTDPRIVGDAMRAAGFPEESWKRRLPAALATMAQQVMDRRHQLQVEVLPGVHRTLQHLQDRGAMLGVATGNLEAIGWLKLEAAGLRDFFSFGSFSDMHEHRHETFRHARVMAEERCGGRARICVLGDTPADVDAARENELPVIAVSTGIFKRKELEACRPGLCLEDLQDLWPAGDGFQP